MAESFERATDDAKMGATMKDFCDYFAEKARIEIEALSFFNYIDNLLVISFVIYKI